MEIFIKIIIMILSKIVMVAGMGCLLAGFLNRRLEVFRQKLFKDL